MPLPNMKNIRLLVVDDHFIFRDSFVYNLSRHSEVEVVGVASDMEEAVEKAEELDPNVIVIDSDTHGIDIVQTTQVLKQKHPDLNVIILTMLSDEERLLKAIKAGANGWVFKEFSSSVLLEAILLETIHAVAREITFYDPANAMNLLKEFRTLVGSKMALRAEKYFLSGREAAILHLIAEGCTNKTIAKRLFISENTVRNHIVSIFSKLGCNNRAKAVKEAFRRGLI
jgi:DNA-binding NarL/FixJ family response regulator